MDETSPLFKRDRAWITVENASVEYERYGSRSHTARKSPTALAAEVMTREATSLCPIGRRFRLAVTMHTRAASFVGGN
jgi:hypothetical protein